MSYRPAYLARDKRKGEDASGRRARRPVKFTPRGSHHSGVWRPARLAAPAAAARRLAVLVFQPLLGRRNRAQRPCVQDLQRISARHPTFRQRHMHLAPIVKPRDQAVIDDNVDSIRLVIPRECKALSVAFHDAHFVAVPARHPFCSRRLQADEHPRIQTTYGASAGTFSAAQARNRMGRVKDVDDLCAAAAGQRQREHERDQCAEPAHRATVATLGSHAN
jgi:hypothetical protein